MKRLRLLRRITAFAAAATLALAPTFAVHAAPAAEKSAPARRHPLRGVITRVDVEGSTLMVKHEAIPGVMRAMTMRFKVAPDVVKKFKTGDAITALMSRVGNEWHLDEVKPAKQ